MDLVTTVLPAINVLLQPIMFVFKVIADTIGSIVGFMTQTVEMTAAATAGATAFFAIKEKNIPYD